METQQLHRGRLIDHLQLVTPDLEATGWPMHARVTIKHLDVVAPSGHAIAAPEMIAQANAYNPTRWVLAAPDGLTVTRGEKCTSPACFSGKGSASGRAVKTGLASSTATLGQRWVRPWMLMRSRAGP